MMKAELSVDEEFKNDHAGFSGDHIIVDRRLDINKQCDEGRTPLHYACCSNNTLLVKDLLKTGADVDVEDQDGYTALHTACCAYQLLKCCFAAARTSTRETSEVVHLL